MRRCSERLPANICFALNFAARRFVAAMRFAKEKMRLRLLSTG
jgi:hypothetical protein